MSPEGFLKRLRESKAVNCIYRSGDSTGLISAWAHDGRFVLTWEECREGEQYEEHAYTKDERHLFPSVEDVLEFVERSGFPASAFTP